MDLVEILRSRPVVMAPMAGITDKSFRLVCARLGCDLAFTEMISSWGVHYRNAATRDMTDFSGEDRLVAQVFGTDPAVMAEAGLAVEAAGALAVDVNAGCPVNKVVKTGAGAALMRQPKLLGRLVRSLVEALKIPVTVKIRSGWDSGSLNAVAVARAARDAGAAAVTVHGRTCRQMYGGRADWGVIAEVAAALDIPVIGNGDISSPDEAAGRLRESGCAGVMVGRACLGNPWIFHRASLAVHGETLPPEPGWPERLRVAREHTQEVLARRGETRGIREMRKHLSWYFRGLPGAARLREKINAMQGEGDAQGVFAAVESAVSSPEG